ncbi:MAG: hypothetical protein SFU98_12695 [Leptospiraceae bacterium]|nr:hypothetical protein [Leptospiraceae bacterium]
MKTSTQSENHATKDDLKTLVSYMDKRFEDMYRYMDKRFDDVNKRFDDMNQKFNWNLWIIGILFSIGISIITYQNQRAIDEEKKHRSSTLKNLIQELESADSSTKELLKKVLE